MDSNSTIYLYTSYKRRSLLVKKANLLRIELVAIQFLISFEGVISYLIYLVYVIKTNVQRCSVE